MSRSVEIELLRRCRAGESRFYEPVVRAYERTALRVAASLLGDPDDARDAVQDAFVRAYQALDRFDVERPFAPWFFRILRNHCRDRLRQRKPRFALSALEQSLPADANVGPERDQERSAARTLLWRGLERIGVEHREVLVLKEIDGFSYAELAEVLEVPEGTIASRLYHARRALRDALRELGSPRIWRRVDETRDRPHRAHAVHRWRAHHTGVRPHRGAPGHLHRV